MIFRIIGLVAGFIVGGSFWTGLLGYFIGRLINHWVNGTTVRTSFSSHHISQDEFIDMLMQLTAAVMQADNKMLKSELDFVKKYLVNNIGVNKAQEAILKLRDYLNQPIDLQNVCENIKNNSNIQERLLIMQFLFGLAQADGHIDATEVNVIRNIAISIGIPASTFESLKSMFMGYSYQGGYGSSYGSSFGSGYGYNSGSSSYSSTTYHNLDDDYKILEVSSDATNEEVKKAYRKAAIKHHPDKVSHLGEEVRKAAEEKFSKVNEAYERIKKSRGMN